jgi:hypothetical protein
MMENAKEILALLDQGAVLLRLLQWPNQTKVTQGESYLGLRGDKEPKWLQADE